MGCVVKTMTRPFYPLERLGTHCIGYWVGTTAYMEGGGKSLPPPGFDSRTVQPVDESFYRLSYPGPLQLHTQNNSCSTTDTVVISYSKPRIRASFCSPNFSRNEIYIWIHKTFALNICFSLINPLAYTAGCETGWATDDFAVNSGFVSVDGMTCLIPFESRRNDLSNGISYM
jgi:hypothetical protein